MRSALNRVGLVRTKTGPRGSGFSRHTAADNHDGASAEASQVIVRPGQPLDGGWRAAAEGFFGHDFSRVRVNSGREAAESASILGARAYTLDQHIVLGPNQPPLGAVAGDRLMAHELVHVHQQFEGRAAGLRRQAQPTGSPDALESEAEAAAEALTRERATAGLGPRHAVSLALGSGSGPSSAAKGGGQSPPGFGLAVRSPASCVAASASGDKMTSSTAIEVSYFKDNDDSGTVSLRDRDASDATLQEVPIPRVPRSGLV